MPTNYPAVVEPVTPTVLDKTVKETPTGQRLLKMRVSRTAEGLSVEMQSDLDFPGFFKKTNNFQMGDFKFGGVTCLECRDGIRVHTNQRLVLNRNDLMAYGEGQLNFSFFMAKDLNRGVTFKFQNLPMSADGLKEWAGQMKECVKALYEDYLKPVDITVSLTAVVKEHEA